MRGWSSTAKPRRSVLAIRLVEADRAPPQRWRNGGGSTRELLAWPCARDWALRLSMADIDADGPFSAFPGVTRWFAVVTGSGVALEFDGAVRHLAVGDPPLRFDGAAAPGCSLIDGPTRDLNLMIASGQGAMLPVVSGAAWNGPFVMRGLFSAVAGRWYGGGTSFALQPRTLLWEDAGEGGEWRFEPDSPGAPVSGWWLGFTP